MTESPKFLKVKERAMKARQMYADSASQFSNFLIYGDFGTGKTPAPIAVVVSLEALVFDRIMIQHFDSSRPEMAAPGHWKVVSRNENRPEAR